MINVRNLKIIESYDWDELVRTTYGKPYCLQQQNGCMDRGMISFKVPSKEFNDDEMHDDIPEEINGEIMGVKFSTWLARDIKECINKDWNDWELNLFWTRNFYPDFETIVNDLYSKGLLEAGEYTMNIDW